MNKSSEKNLFFLVVFPCVPRRLALTQLSTLLLVLWHDLVARLYKLACEIVKIYRRTIQNCSPLSFHILNNMEVSSWFVS